MGGEFISDDLKDFLKSKNATIFHVGSEHKAAMVERVIQTLQQISQAYAQNSNEQFSVLDNLEKIVKTYNDRGHSALDFVSPNEYIHKDEVERVKPIYESAASKNEPSISTKTGNFLYEENNKIIEHNMFNAAKKFPILSSVKLSTTKRSFLKNAKSEKFTFETYFIYKLKRPVLSNEPVLFKIVDVRGRELTGSFSENELKKVKSTKNISYFVINGIREVFVDDKSGLTKFVVTVLNLPKDLLFVLSKSQLSTFSLTQAAIIQLKNYKV